MDNVAIFPVIDDSRGTLFRAVSRAGQSEGRTAGEALDALRTATSQTVQSSTVVVIQPFLPDALFTAEQQSRLQELMLRWRAARDAGQTLAPDEQAELQALVDAELRAATTRSAQIVQGLGG
ncbi:MAG TPA: hypothetical protein VFB96_26285 [Pirellulaceae bacterium]|jgi:hypothetical protein|nr:hypothetical protein [Pirellulaceae bacterium]